MAYHQRPAAVYYCAYPRVNPRNIVNNARLRDGLFAADMTDQEAQSWLRRL